MEVRKSLAPKIINPYKIYPYELDNFQKWAHYSIHHNENVLVTAHTGSGKTCVADYAIAKGIENNYRVLYTSPIKTLSNQKYAEFKNIYSNVGILTGDIKINPDGDIIIMTTEILRKLLIKKEEEIEEDIRNVLHNVKCVIFDEVHYINDRSRGYVWETCLTLLNPEIQLVLLSATINNPESFAEWLGNIKKVRMNLIPTTHRVIPLNHYIYNNGKLDLINDNNDNFNSKLYKDIKIDKEKRIFSKVINPFVEFLKNKNYLPCLFFIFSRKLCSKYAKNIQISLIDAKTQSIVTNKFDTYIARYGKIYEHSEQVFEVKQLLLKGICIHHSGLIPLLKEIIEILFGEGYIKILFATETFAVGVNMPTKTCVFTSFSKYDGYINNLRTLETAEYKQMAGRAGRRGLDTVGHVIYLPINDMIDVSSLCNMMTGKVNKITSKFSISFSYVINCLGKGSLMIDTLLEKTFYNVEHNTLVRNIQKTLENWQEINISYINVELMKKILEKTFNITNIKPKHRRKYQNEIDIMIDEYGKDYISHMKIYNDYLQNINCKKENEEILEYRKIEMRKSLINNMKLLEEWDYVKNINYDNLMKVSNDNLTIKGKVCNCFLETPDLLITELLHYNNINNLSDIEIIGLLSIFCDEKQNDDDDYTDISKNLNTCIKYVEYIYEETKNTCPNMYFDWTINYGLLQSSMMWVSGNSFSDIKSECEIYEGNFIKGMIKIYKMCEELKNALLILNNQEMYDKLINISTQIMRDIVNIESLYI